MFKNRFIELLDTRLDYSQLSHYISDIEDDIRLEIPAQSDRFGYPLNYNSWIADMSNTDYYLRHRVQNMKDKLQIFFGNVDENKENNICIYPNPTSGVINIIIKNPYKQDNEIRIYDVMGRTVFLQAFDMISQDNIISFNTNLKAGVYLLKIGNTAQRIIIQ